MDMTSTPTPATTHHTITSRTLLRRNMEAAISAATMPVKVVECDLEDVDLSGLDLTPFTFERCTLIKADLSHVKAQGTLWTSCRARQVKACGGDFTDAVFKSGDWNNADWTNVGIAGAKFEGVKLTGGTFAGAKTIGATFVDCLMRSCDLRGMSFRKSKLGRCDMTEANLGGVDLRDSFFDEGSSLAGAAITDAKFAGADLRRADLSGHGLASITQLKGARMSAEQAVQMIRAAGIDVG